MRWLPFLLCALAFACDDEAEATPDSGAPAADAGVCDPEGDPALALLQAPTDATVVRKQPAHPPVGDAGLP